MALSWLLAPFQRTNPACIGIQQLVDETHNNRSRGPNPNSDRTTEVVVLLLSDSLIFVDAYIRDRIPTGSALFAYKTFKSYGAPFQPVDCYSYIYF